ncbi:nucleotidyltransferase domain-containing protein [Cellulomonas phragmiteti]|nr:nucleotidyltransferase domain-containing protein [Cellulomonas phragmiteti]
MEWTMPERVFGPSLDTSVLFALWRAGTHLTGGQAYRLTATGSERGVRYALERLVAHGIVTSWSVGSANLYAVNHDHLSFPAVDAAFRALNPWTELARRVERLVAEVLPPDARGSGLRPPDVTVCVFGSVARGTAGPDSDLDLFVVVPDDAEGSGYLVEQLELQGRSWTGQRVQVYLATHSDLARARAAGDPLIESLRADARRVLGPSIDHLLRKTA